MKVDDFFKIVLKCDEASDYSDTYYVLDSLQASGRIMFLKSNDGVSFHVLITQLFMEQVVPAFLSHDPSNSMLHQAGWVQKEIVKHRFPDILHAKYLLNFLQELGLCSSHSTRPSLRSSTFFPTLVEENEGWWGGTCSRSWAWYCGTRVQVPASRGHKLPPSLLCRLIVTLLDRFGDFAVRVSKCAGTLLLLTSCRSCLPSSFLNGCTSLPPVHIRGFNVGDCRVELCLVRNEVDKYGRYLRYFDVAERWKRRPSGAEEWAQAGKLRDTVLLEFQKLHKQFFGELPVETLLLGEFDSSGGPRPVGEVISFVLLDVPRPSTRERCRATPQH